MKRRVNATIRIGQGFDVEIEADVEGDNARGPSERIVEGEILALHPKGRRVELADRYEYKAVVVLLEADACEDDDR